MLTAGPIINASADAVAPFQIESSEIQEITPSQVPIESLNMTATAFSLPGGQTTLSLDAVDNLTLATASVESKLSLTSTSCLLFQGKDDCDDTLSLDLATLPRASNGALKVQTIIYNGGRGGYDTLIVQGGSFEHETYYATGHDSGILTYDDLTVIFTGLEPVYDFSDATSYDFYGQSSDDNINVDLVNAYESYDENGDLQYSGPYSGDVGPFTSLHIYDTHSPANFEDATVSINNKQHITVHGGGGNDTINANFSYTSYSGGMTDFAVYGGEGNDAINATTLSTTCTVSLYGEAGNDAINISRNTTGFGTSTVDGGTQSGGVDTLNWNDSGISGTHTYAVTSSDLDSHWVDYTTFETVSITGGTSSNTFNVTSNASGTTLNLTGNSSGDTFNIGGAGSGTLGSIAGTINLDGAGGTDTVNINDGTPTTGFIYTLGSSSVTRSSATINYNVNNHVENLVLNASGGNDTINISSTPSIGTVTINGNNGNDVFNLSVTANATLTLAGGNGNDTYAFNPVSGNLGGATISESSNAGTDTLDFSAFNSGVAIRLDNSSKQTVLEGTLSLTVSGGTGIENVVGGNGNDTITGDAGANLLMGGAGNDTIKGESGNDILYGGAGNDWLYGDDSCNCFSGNDQLYGNEGDDYLFGGPGIDRLDGGPGIDVFQTGGQAADLIVDVPQIVNFNAQYDHGIVSVSGQVVDDADPTDYTVYFGDLLDGCTTFADSDGRFLFSMELDLGFGDFVSAWTVDSEGLYSNFATTFLT